jgi:hypothetical protein
VLSNSPKVLDGWINITRRQGYTVTTRDNDFGTAKSINIDKYRKLFGLFSDLVQSGLLTLKLPKPCQRLLHLINSPGWLDSKIGDIIMWLRKIEVPNFNGRVCSLEDLSNPNGPVFPDLDDEALPSMAEICSTSVY